jgi:hypothetical protein
MRQFNILLEDRPGELARVTAALTHTNIRSLSTERNKNSKTLLKLITHDTNSTKSALTKAGFEFTESEILVVSLIDRPGELHKLATRLGNEGINILDVYLIEKATLALYVDKSQIERAKELLAENLLV